MTISVDNVIQRWKSLPSNYSEANLGMHLMPLIWDAIGVNFQQVKNGGLGAGAGLNPDYLIYNPLGQPRIVVEIKKRTNSFYGAPEAGFSDFCQGQNLYKDAVGYNSTGNNQ